MENTVPGRPIEILKTVFGYDSFRPPQEEVIEHLLNGRDALVLMPTGGGKSLCYQIPALLRPGIGIVVSPLIALMQDQVNALLQLGVRAAFLNSTLSLEQVRAIESRLLAGEIDLLYIAPERLTSERTQSLFERLRIALFAIDEAHCVSQWGHDFRADYLQLSLLHERFPAIPRIALTATADAKTRQEIIARLGLEEARLFLRGFDRPNIRYRIVQKNQAKRQLIDFIRSEHAGDAGIVYCLSRKKVEETAEWLNSNGIHALPYHAGMAGETRQLHQHRFLMEDGLVIVATIAFGMGIDKPNVRFVAHLDLPKSVEAYYQETGRAGRDGLPADAWMAYGLQDVITLRRMLADSDADDTHKRLELHKLDAMLAFCEQVHCRRQALLNYFGDELVGPCGNCDTCLEPVKTWDGTVAAQQALSCIYRTGQRFGAAYLIDVLMGKATERVLKFGHDRLSTYGIGKALSEPQWHSVFRQLAARSLVSVDFERHGALKLTEACRPILRGEEPLRLRMDLQQKQTRAGRDARRQPDKNEDLALWDALRAKRREFADAQDVPPYIIFNDATLMAMLEAKPTDLRQMAKLPGIGEHKLKLYGEPFLAVIREHGGLGSDTATLVAETVDTTLELFRLGYGIEQIAKKRLLKETTIYSHLAQGIEQGRVALQEVIELPEAELRPIEEALLGLPEDQKNSLKPVYERFEGIYSYDVLRCVRAALQRQTA
ncbi:MAG: DNA helicase RecQ [Gammaproteobacteria bacterium]